MVQDPYRGERPNKTPFGGTDADIYSRSGGTTKRVHDALEDPGGAVFGAITGQSPMDKVKETLFGPPNEFQAEAYQIGPGLDADADRLRSLGSQAYYTHAGYQMPYLDQLKAQAAGTAGPSAAENMLQAGLDRNMRQQMAMAASAGGNPAQQAAAMNQAMANAAGQAQAASNDAAALRAREQQAFQQLYGQQIGQAAGATVDQQTLGLEQAMANQRALEAAQQVNAQVAAQNTERNTGIMGGIMGAAGSALSFLSDIRAKEGVSLLDERTDRWRQERLARGLGIRPGDPLDAPPPSDDDGGGGFLGALLSGVGKNTQPLSDERSKERISELEGELAAERDANRASLRRTLDDPRVAERTARMAPDVKREMYAAAGYDPVEVELGPARIEPSPADRAALRGVLGDPRVAERAAQFSPEAQAEMRHQAGMPAGYPVQIGQAVIEPTAPPTANAGIMQPFSDAYDWAATRLSDERSKDVIRELAAEKAELKNALASMADHANAGAPFRFERGGGIVRENPYDALATAEGSREGLAPMRAYEFSYKPEFAAAQGTDTGPRAGIMAQEMERSPYLSHAVVDTPMGKAIDGERALTGTMAATAGIDKRLRDLEDSLANYEAARRRGAPRSVLVEGEF